MCQAVMVLVGPFQLQTFCDVRNVSGDWVSHNTMNLVISEIFSNLCNSMVSKNHSGVAALLILKDFSSAGGGGALEAE